ncbi:MAG: 23S rRNA (uracil(1939)-C(5))-methyltransferase RlmD [Deltaproteobacteria bacterium]|nr:23S rRNA (uracil(1939)-C(5))-methyltransferase RlmD [Deltaproteobacteria bacterium]
MKLKKNDLIELTIDKMAFGGKGIARIDGFVLFVRGAVPGDRVIAKVLKKKKDYAEAAIVELLAPSRDRIEAPCPYFGYCGGCQWQHVGYERQLFFKREVVKESLEHIGGLKNIAVCNTLPSENIFSYRNKMEFSFSDRRWLLPHEFQGVKANGKTALGLHVPGTYSKVIDLDACLLQEVTGNRILNEVKRYVTESGIPVYGLKNHLGFWRFLTIRYSRAFDEWMVNIVTSENRPETIRPLADMLCDRIGDVKTVLNNITKRKASVAVGEQEVIYAGKGYIEDMIGPFRFQISANSFFQTNTPAAEKLCQKVKDYAELAGSETVLDLYSGTGTIPIFISKKVRSVTGIEISRDAILNAEKNCDENGIHNCNFICGDIREKISSITYRPDVLIIDPPRAGMHKDVLAQVMTLLPEKIVYVSCNPASLARDLERIVKDYELIEVQPVDMFPHTYHIEAVAKLRLRNK